jgi:hypothetical protein
MMPAICNRAPKTRAGAERQYNAVIRAYKHAFDGGGMFGWDWRTFEINWQEGYAKAQRLAHLANTLEP